MAKAAIDEFRKLDANLIQCDECIKEQLVQCLWEFVHAIFMKMHKIATAKFVTWNMNHLTEDLRNKHPHVKTLPNNWRDLLRWHGELEGATKDEIAWRSRQLPFDDKNKMKELATRFKFDIGVGYDSRNKSGWVETLNKHSKRLTQKTMQDKRRSTHGKLLNSTSTNDKTPKKNNPE